MLTNQIAFADGIIEASCACGRHVLKKGIRYWLSLRCCGDQFHESTIGKIVPFLCDYLATAVLMFCLIIVSCGEHQQKTNDAPTVKTTMTPEQVYFEDNVATLRFEVLHVGPTDKPIFPLIVGVAAMKSDLGVTEIEVDGPARRRRAYVALINETEGLRIIRRLFEGRFFNGRFACTPDQISTIGGYNIRLSASGEVHSATISRAGNRVLRLMLLECLDASNQDARQQVRKSLGM